MICHCTHTATDSHKCSSLGSCNFTNLIQSPGSSDLSIVLHRYEACLVQIEDHISTKLFISLSVCPEFEDFTDHLLNPMALHMLVTSGEHNDIFQCRFMKPIIYSFPVIAFCCQDSGKAFPFRSAYSKARHLTATYPNPA